MSQTQYTKYILYSRIAVVWTNLFLFFSDTNHVAAAGVCRGSLRMSLFIFILFFHLSVVLFPENRTFRNIGPRLWFNMRGSPLIIHGVP